MKHIQPKTYRIMLAALANPKFSQRGLWKICNQSLSIGQVNKVINELHTKGFVEKLWGKGKGNYVLADPVGLLRYIALFRQMGELKAFTSHVDATHEDVFETLKRMGVVFCLGTAQELYTPYYRPDRTSFYSANLKEIKSFLETARRGNLRLDCYSVGKDEELLNNKMFSNNRREASLTTKIQTNQKRN